MTEAEWSACDDVERLVGVLRGRKLSRRKWKLFHVACCRQIWQVMTDIRCRRAVEVAESFADGKVSEEDLAAVRAAVRARGGMQTAGDLARSVAGGPLYFSVRLARVLALRHAGLDQRDQPADAAARARQAVLVRDIIRNPFQPPSVADPVWLAWNSGTITKMAQVIYDDRRFADLPILADALEDAGCTDAAVLGHCRGGGEHVRGCWVVDLLLGKE